MQNIVKYFKKAGLDLTLTDKPIGRVLQDENSNRIFQMTIDQGKREKFRIFLGQGNDIRVLDADPKKEQVLLYVKEPKRVFKEVHYDREQHRDVETVRETPDHIRRYLMGMDETHLFISELPDRQGKINKIADAHKVLKPYDVKDRKKRKKVKIQRQGEWFFVSAVPSELLLIEEHLKLQGKLNTLKINEPLDSRGKPHTAENLLRIADNIFVKGKIRHEDHKTKEFFTWQRVFRNTENRLADSGRVRGWID